MAYFIQEIPENSNVLLSRDVFYYMLMQVPQGRLTRREDVEQYLADCFGVHHVRFDLSAWNFMRYASDLVDYVYDLLDYVPMHREVTSRGYIVYSPDQIRKLEKEGFLVESPLKPGYSPKVRDYKKYLIDFHKESNIPVQTLKDVNENGLREILRLRSAKP